MVVDLIEMIYESQYLHVLFLFFVFETPLKDFPFFSPLVLTPWFRYLQIRIKESCVYLSHQLLFKTPHETLKFQEKPKTKAFCRSLQT